MLGGAGRLLWLRRGGEGTEESELERALRGAGEAWTPATTLVALEARLPGASGYLGALRASRYASGAGPSKTDRRDLRRALSAGRGPVVRARVVLALRVPFGRRRRARRGPIGT